MPNRDVHRPAAMAVGGGYAYAHARRRYRRRSQTAAPVVAETLGGIAGGWVGGALPDWIDPPVCPNHRHVGHGMATVAGAVWLTADMIFKFQQQLRARADMIQANRHLLQSDLLRALSVIEEYILRFVVGALNGLTAGYVSHLALDFLTPSGLPVFARGF